MWLGDRDALRVVLKFNDEVEALELMEFIDGTVLQRADDIFTKTRVAVWAVVLGEIIVVVGAVAPECNWRARLSR